MRTARVAAGLVAGASLAFLALFGAASVRDYRTGRPQPELALFNQTLASMAAGRGTRNWNEGDHGRVHVSPVLWALVPAYRLAGRPETPLLANVLLVAVTAPLLFAYARRRGLEPGTAAAAATVFLLSPVAHGLALSGFHELAFACPLSVLLALSIERGPSVRAGTLAAALAMLAVREDMALAVGGIGAVLLVAGPRPKRSLGAVLVGVALAWAIGCGQIMALYQAAEPDAALKGGSHLERYAHLGGSWPAVLASILRHPAALLAGARPKVYLAYLFLAGSAGACLLAPGWSLVAAGLAVVNLASLYPVQRLVGTHYSAAIAGLLGAALVLGVGRLRANRRAAALVLAACACCLTIALDFSGFTGQWTYRPHERFRNTIYGWEPFTPADLAARDRLAGETAACRSVLVSTSVAAPFSNHAGFIGQIDPAAIFGGGVECVVIDLHHLPERRELEEEHGPGVLRALNAFLLDRYAPQDPTPEGRLLWLRKKQAPLAPVGRDAARP